MRKDDVQESEVLQKRSGQRRLYNENLISLVAALVVTLRVPIPGYLFWVPDWSHLLLPHDPILVNAVVHIFAVIFADIFLVGVDETVIGVDV